MVVKEKYSEDEEKSPIFRRNSNCAHTNITLRSLQKNAWGMNISIIVVVIVVGIVITRASHGVRQMY